MAYLGTISIMARASSARFNSTDLSSEYTHFNTTPMPKLAATSQSGHALIVYPLMVLCVIAVAENIFVCSLIYCNRVLRSATTNVFVFSLCVANLLFASILIPLHCFDQYSLAYKYLTLIIVLTYIANLTAVTYERHVSITKPLHYVNIVTKKRAYKILFFCYVVPVIYCLIPLLWGATPQRVVHKAYMVVTMIAFLIAPLVFILWVYGKVCLETRKFYRTHRWILHPKMLHSRDRGPTFFEEAKFLCCFQRSKINDAHEDLRVNDDTLCSAPNKRNFVVLWEEKHRKSGVQNCEHSIPEISSLSTSSFNRESAAMRRPRSKSHCMNKGDNSTDLISARALKGATSLPNIWRYVAEQTLNFEKCKSHLTKLTSSGGNNIGRRTETERKLLLPVDIASQRLFSKWNDHLANGNIKTDTSNTDSPLLLPAAERKRASEPTVPILLFKGENDGMKHPSRTPTKWDFLKRIYFHSSKKGIPISTKLPNSFRSHSGQSVKNDDMPQIFLYDTELCESPNTEPKISEILKKDSNTAGMLLDRVETNSDSRPGDVRTSSDSTMQSRNRNRLTLCFDDSSDLITHDPLSSPAPCNSSMFFPDNETIGFDSRASTSDSCQSPYNGSRNTSVSVSGGTRPSISTDLSNGSFSLLSPDTHISPKNSLSFEFIGNDLEDLDEDSPLQHPPRTLSERESLSKSRSRQRLASPLFGKRQFFTNGMRGKRSNSDTALLTTADRLPLSCNGAGLSTRSHTMNHDLMLLRQRKRGSDYASSIVYRTFHQTNDKIRHMLTELRSSFTFALVALTYMFTWLPVVYMTFLDVIDLGHLISEKMINVSIFTIGLNAVIDPLLYGLLLKDFRKALKRLYRLCKY